jgi:hypothetical protein
MFKITFLILWLINAAIFVVFAIKLVVNGILRQQEYLRKNLLPVSERIFPAPPLKILIPLIVSILLASVLTDLL